MQKHHVYSTMTAPVSYATYVPGGADLPVVEKKVLINGGAGVVDKKSLHTPRGVVTTISDEDLQHLLKNEVFKVHQKNGFITVSAAEENADKVAVDMVSRDESSPLTPEDFADDAATKPVEGKPKRK